jgi:aromatic-L-amino-acid/L-tryptophan decarboxylase
MGFERLAATDFSGIVYCYRLPGDKREEVLETPYIEVLQRVDATGEVFLSPARAACRFALRLAIGSIRTGERHAERVWHLARDAAECLPVAPQNEDCPPIDRVPAAR